LKDEFIGFVSHQLCSPLTVIIGATQTALADESRLAKNKQRQLLQITVTEAQALYHMVSNLLELSRLQSNRLILDNEEIDVADAINNVITRIQHEYSDYQFVTNLAKDTPILYADPVRLELILYNIIENAVKYSPTGSKIRICTRANAEEITFGVVDHGPGIPAYSLPKIFEPFQRVEESHITPVKGAGLGLLVCKRLVEVHGGKIWAKSKRGHGSTFYFSLPIYGNNADNS
jgi:signal transduction histidine kinase